MVLSRFLVSSIIKARVGLTVFSKSDYSSLTNFRLCTTASNNIFEERKVFKRSFESKPNFRNEGHKKFVALQTKDLSKADIENMLVPYNYYLSVPNERFGYGLMEGFNYWMKLPSDVIEFVNNIWVSAYEAGALLDDIVDESHSRRGLLTSPQLLGIGRTAICSQGVFFLILKRISELNNPKAVETYINSMIMYCVGLYKETDNTKKMICPTLSEFEETCINKCDGIAGLPIKMMQVLSDTKTDYTHLLHLFSLHCQYINDVANMSEQKTWNAKSYLEDISEGKFTLPTIHAVRSGTFEGQTVHNILRSKTKDVATLSYCLSLLEKLGSIEFAINTTRSLENKIREEIKKFGGNPPLEEYLDTIMNLSYDEKYPTYTK
ncbi:terpene synthase-like [Phymastichus coffea]|uniref:terpene synthase-like n=1 Tax=Phymastichus coffea TaxID=108790 RepID=UPI00273C52DF|nr:terpene synthase-like [Phymastichus coffea]